MKKQIRFNVLAVAVALATVPLVSQQSYAAGLGRITVQSSLGQPLRARMEVTASADELPTIAAKLASADAFRLAGVEFAPVLSDLRFSPKILEDAGRRYIEISSNRPLNEPFVDMLVELSWSSGRLVREYTFLLDPPEMAAPASAIVSPQVDETTAARVAASPPERVVSVIPAPGMASAPVAVAPVETRTPPAPPVREAKPAASVTTAAGVMQERLVKPGDTLGKIANEVRPEGVSLDQMLVALFRANTDAFDGNMNRMRAGKILRLPDPVAVATVDAGAAHTEVRAQSADFNAYKKRLAERAASAPAKAESTAQESRGTIKPKVEEPLVPAKPAGDKLAVSRGEAGKAGGAAASAARANALEEDLVARERALKEANSRISDLEKNLNDLKKLAEAKAAAGAAAKGAAVAPAVKPVAAESTPKEAPLKPADSLASAAPAVTTTKPPTSVPTAKSDAKPPVKAKKPVPPPPEPSFMEENAPLVYGGAGVLALIAAFFGFKLVRRRKASATAAVPVGDDSHFSTASELSETAGSSMLSTTVAAAGEETSVIDTVGGGDTAHIDPLEEADTYLAFGKDSQAEEILLDALKAEPGRLAVHLKLLEIYAGRRANLAFNTLAEDLKQQTGGEGPEWARAVELGMGLDPNNPLYQPPVAESPKVVDADMEATMVFSAPPPQTSETMAETAGEPASDLDFDLGLDSPEKATDVSAAAGGTDDASVLDFDLDLGEGGDSRSGDTPAEVVAPTVPALDIDFDLELPTTTDESSGQPSAPLTLDVDAVLPATPDVSGAPAAPAANGHEASVAAVGKSADISFDFDLGEDHAPKIAGVPDAASPSAMPEYETTGARMENTESTPEAALDDDTADNPEAATKLELALAYEEMGDREGARELFEEVLSEGNAAQQATARSKLDLLG